MSDSHSAAAHVTLGDRFRNLPQYLLPQRLSTRLTYWVTRARTPWLKNWLIQSFIQHFRVNMAEALEPNPRAYPDFNAFFTRSLKPRARPITPGGHAPCCPVDGAISQIGNVEADTLLQAKGRHFSLTTLLGDDPARAQAFHNVASSLCTCRRATITASTCRWPASCERWCTSRANCSACRR